MSGRLTFDRPDGSWGVVGMNEENEGYKMYMVAAKLHAYEKSGLSPSDLEDLCAIVNEWSERQEGRFTRKADGFYHVIECFKRCNGECDSTCADREVDAAIIQELGRYEDTGLSPTEYADVVRIIGRVAPKKMTRAERIRALTNDEMADLILRGGVIDVDDKYCRPDCTECDDDLLFCPRQRECILAWLNEEVRDDQSII